MEQGEVAVDALPARTVWEVAGLVHAVSDALAARFAACTVRGELSGLARAASGHCYFTLKDAAGAAASVRCVMFRRAAMQLAFAPSEGQIVEVRGRLALYEPRGEVQIVVEAMRAGGAGALYEEFLRRKARLEAEGLFDAARKRSLPPHPRALGIVTSTHAAALRDVLTCLRRRAPHVRVVLYPAPVQGPQAPEAVAEAIARANARCEVDALIVCRGGGSLEDLWAFNDERLVRAIAASGLPVVCGVGHETDVTLADLAADVRAPTPTAAAEVAAPQTRECRALLEALHAALRRPVHQALERNAQRLDRLSARLSRPAEAVRRHALALGLLQHRLRNALPQGISQRRARIDQLGMRLAHRAASRRAQEDHRLRSLAARMESLDPRRVLARGYAWLTDGAGRAIVSAREVSPGEEIGAVLADGVIEARVLRTAPREG